MSKENTNTAILGNKGGHFALVKKIGKTTYRVSIHFSTTSRETMSDKIKRMIRNEVSRM